MCPLTGVGQLVADLCVHEDGGLVGPAPGHVLQHVASAAQHQGRHVQLLLELDALPAEVREARQFMWELLQPQDMLGEWQT